MVKLLTYDKEKLDEWLPAESVIVITTFNTKVITEPVPMDVINMYCRGTGSKKIRGRYIDIYS